MVLGGPRGPGSTIGPTQWWGDIGYRSLVCRLHGDERDMWHRYTHQMNMERAQIHRDIPRTWIHQICVSILGVGVWGAKTCPQLDDGDVEGLHQLENSLGVGVSRAKTWTHLDDGVVEALHRGGDEMGGEDDWDEQCSSGAATQARAVRPSSRTWFNFFKRSHAVQPQWRLNVSSESCNHIYTPLCPHMAAVCYSPMGFAINRRDVLSRKPECIQYCMNCSSMDSKTQGLWLSTEACSSMWSVACCMCVPCSLARLSCDWNLKCH